MAWYAFLQDEDETDSPGQPNRSQMSEQLISQFENRVSSFVILLALERKVGHRDQRKIFGLREII